LLRRGNDDFLHDRSSPPALDRQSRLRLAAGQAPFAAYVSCSDSRVPPELLFGRGLGELFIVRNAGNTVDALTLGSVEFAVAYLDVPLIVVMGHEKCGAVEAAMAAVENRVRFPGAISRVVEPIVGAVTAVRRQGRLDSEAVARENVRRTVIRLREDRHSVLFEPQRAGRLKVVGAYYSLASGRVDFFV
jgi:carbonic anhydrase